MKSLIVLALMATLAAAPPPIQVPPPIAAAVADPARPQADRDADSRRHIAETVAFAGVRPGMKVVELFPGKGYFTRVISKTVGPQGLVYTIPWQEPDTGSSRVIARDPAYANVRLWEANFFGFKPEAPVDMLFTVQNYHDIMPAQRAQVNQLVFRMLKPGGVYFIADHSARDGSGHADVNALHRIDEALVIQEVQRAGFKLDAKSDLLRNSADDRKLNVFNPAIRGRTDQFMLRFLKPG